MGMMLRRRGEGESLTTSEVLTEDTKAKGSEKDKKQEPVKRTRKPKQ